MERIRVKKRTGEKRREKMDKTILERERERERERESYE